jgi:hypothetical protein
VRAGVWPAGLIQKPGQGRLGLLGYVVKAQARIRIWPGPNPALVLI